MSRGLNKVMVIGHLGRDPEMRFTPSGKSVANFSVACNRSWKSSNGETHTETEWFNVVAWGSLAERAKNMLSKGRMIYVEGRLQTRTWQDNEGHPHKSVEIVAHDLLLLSEKQNYEDPEESEDHEEYPF